jgi:predicted nuclease of predicted toxin-antitoxin system
MKIVADEGVDRSVVVALRAEHHEVIYVAELTPGISDDEVLGMAREQSAVLLTADKDFGELVFRLNRAAEGIVLMRLEGLPTEAKATIVANVFRTRGAELCGCFSVITSGTIRIRRQL